MRLRTELVFLALLAVGILISGASDTGATVPWLLVSLAVAAVAALTVDGSLAAARRAFRRSLRAPASADAIVWTAIAAAAFPIAFFLAGAVGFPLLDRDFRWTFLVTAGVANMLWGIESVLRLGHVETCGFFSGSCVQHDVRWIGFALWGPLSVLVIALRQRARRSLAASTERERR